MYYIVYWVESTEGNDRVTSRCSGSLLTLGPGVTERCYHAVKAGNTNSVIKAGGKSYLDDTLDTHFRICIYIHTYRTESALQTNMYV